MESNPLRGLFGVSSPRPVEQRVAPQPTEPTENVYFEIPLGMIEKLLANPCHYKKIHFRDDTCLSQ